MTSLAISRMTGRPVAAASSLAVQSAHEPAVVPTGLRQIIRPQAQARWILPQLSSITPTYIESVLRGAFAGGHIQAWELMDLMEDTWPRLAKNLGELKGAVCAMDWHLEPWCEHGEAPTPAAVERAALIEHCCWKMRPMPDLDENAFEQTIYDLADAYAKGVSVVEVLWEIRDNRRFGDVTAPRATMWVHPVNYAWSNEGQLGLRTEVYGSEASLALRTTNYQPGRMALEPFPPDQFLISVQKARSGTALTAGRLRALAWWWCAANFSGDWLMNLAQVFGLPIRWATYPSGATQATINKIAEMLEDMGSAGWAAFPEGTNLTLHTPGSLGTMSPQADLLDRADKNCDILILGQTLTSEVNDTGGAFAAAKVHAGVKGEFIQALANAVARVLNTQLVPAILRLNYGDEEEAPEFVPSEHKVEDLKANADRDAVLVAMGIEIPKAWFYERHGIPMPQEGEEIVKKAPVPAMPEPIDRVEDLEDDSDEDAVDVEGKAALGGAAGDVVRMVTALADDLKPIRIRLEKILAIENPDILTVKLEEFQRELPQLLKDINADPKSARVLEGMMHTAFLKGLKK